VTANLDAMLGPGARTDWCTPPEVLERVYRVGPVALDPCSSAEGIVVATHRAGPAVPDALCADGLSFDWADPDLGEGIVFMNPPFGREVGAWVARARATAAAGRAVIGLVPARVDTRWWRESVAPPKADAVCFWGGRVRFLGAPASAPFPIALVYWGDSVALFSRVFRDVGDLWVP